ncbi:MAG: hypothetical protein EXX96DRAFT_534433 [Benjaminiella poitrasii]|nr:MAG: hypothetical protein EXX96DRAFT_534433 [Benjaminiella poitrasii]
MHRVINHDRSKLQQLNEQTGSFPVEIKILEKKKTEDEVLQLFQRFRLGEKAAEETVKNEHDLPLEIIQLSEDNHLYQFQEYIKKYKRGLPKYFHEQWTVGETINRELVPELKKHTEHTQQVGELLFPIAERTGRTSMVAHACDREERVTSSTTAFQTKSHDLRRCV